MDEITMLSIVDVADIFATMYARCRTVRAEAIVSHAASVYYTALRKGRVRTVGQCLHRARLECDAGRDFGRKEAGHRRVQQLPKDVTQRGTHGYTSELTDWLSHHAHGGMLQAWLHGNTMADIGERFGCDKSTVSRIIQGVINEMKEIFA